jgi:hypothetical protein
MQSMPRKPSGAHPFKPRALFRLCCGSALASLTATA